MWIAVLQGVLDYLLDEVETLQSKLIALRTVFVDVRENIDIKADQLSQKSLQHRRQRLSAPVFVLAIERKKLKVFSSGLEFLQSPVKRAQVCLHFWLAYYESAAMRQWKSHQHPGYSSAKQSRHLTFLSLSSLSFFSWLNSQPPKSSSFIQFFTMIS